MDSRSHYITSADDAEHFAAARMRGMGFGDAKVTASGPDGGLDIVSGGAVAQVKWRHAKVGRPDLQRLYGARGSDHSKYMLFFTELFSEAPYTPQAVDYANEQGIGLFAYTSDLNLFPQNKYAVDFVAGIDRVRAARTKKAARMAVVRQVVWSFLLLCSLCGVLITAIDGDSAVTGWLVATVLSALGLALAWFYQPGVK
ncbi:restriction endonuclease [Rhodococcus rhodochrous]|uniref:restriction endonuclease n=1 Tax=Rhodococcus rhodochrous TaxID=1829 RepID=UPI0006C86479|nr:restriction endonuclease [Rhodococcus rhodochrous]